MTKKIYTNAKTVIYALMLLFTATFWINANILAFFTVIGVLCSAYILLKSPSTVTLLFLAYAIIGIISNINVDDITSIKSVLIPFGIFFLFLFAIRIADINIDTICGIILVGCTPLAVIMYSLESPGVYNFSLDHLLNRDRWMGYHVIGSLERVGPTIFSQIVGLLLIISIYLTIKTKGYLNKLLLTIVDLIFVFLLINSGSRTAFIAAIFSSLLIMIAPKSGDTKLKIASTPFYVMALLFVIAFIVNQAASTSDDLSNRLSSFGDLSNDESFSTRLILWSNALIFAQDNLLGGSLIDFFNRYGLSPHNEVLGTLLSTGVFGVTIYLLLWIFLLSKSWMLYHRGYGSLYFSVAVFTVFVSFTEHFTFSNSRFFTPLLFALLGIMMAKVNAIRMNK